MAIRKIAILTLIYCSLFMSAAWSQEPGALETINQSVLAGGQGGSQSGGGQGIQSSLFTGASVYSIELPVPPGRNGIEPNLVLNYNSFRRNPNSWVGYGWELDLGSINRIPSQGSIDYVNGADFESRFGGQAEILEKIQENVNPQNFGIDLADFGGALTVDRYAAKIESAFNIYLHLQDRTNPNAILEKGWMIIDKSGKRYFFGINDRSRLESMVGNGAISEHRVDSWRLVSVYDPNGNSMNARYSDLGHLRTISYQDMQLTFLLDDVDLAFPIYRQFTLSRAYTRKRLRSIMIHKGANVLHQISFSYEIDPQRGVQNLRSFQQCSTRRVPCLPATTFTYYDHQDPQWEAQAIQVQANQGPAKGFLNEHTTLADMNGDGLVDQVSGNKDDGSFKVLYNNGHHFVDRGAASNWAEPFAECLVEDKCKGKITAEREGHQWMYLMDINGDNLPDRICREDVGNGRANWRIAFNTGSGWDENFVSWVDPYRGDWAGASDDERGFADMNGDGLVDRLARNNSDPQNCGIDVYYNTGDGFQDQPKFWLDPLGSDGPNLFQCGKIFATTPDQKIYLAIRDMNGDGLPDRLIRYARWRAPPQGDLRANWNVNFNYVTYAIFNKNGKEWHKNTICEGARIGSCLAVDGVNVTYVQDPEPSWDYEGYASSKFRDWIDMNGNGYLDRVVGNPGNRNFNVYSQKGMNAFNALQLSNATAFPDPASNNDGWEAEGHVNGFVGKNRHSFIQDINGDGFPERVTLTERNNNELDRNYLIYRLKVNPNEDPEAPAFLNDPSINQPVGALKEINDGIGNITEVTYRPTTRPFVEDRIEHRFLPMNLYVLDTLYQKDPSMPVDNAESAWRKTQYNYYGGNFYVRKAQNNRSYFASFDGFQKVTQTKFGVEGEDWDTIETVSYFKQARGDVNILGDQEAALFDVNSYGHLSLSGSPYKEEIFEDGVQKIMQTQDWTLEAPDGDLFACNGPCFPKMTSVIRHIYETPDQSRTSEIRYAYDSLGNVIQESNYDGVGNLLLEKDTSYYAEDAFDADLRIRARPFNQSESLGQVTYREKEFSYDAAGNPTQETFRNPNAQDANIIRSFNPNGTVQSITDTDGVTKNMDYDADGLFPIAESVPVGEQSLDTDRTFYRLTGETEEEINPQSVGSRIERDAYGRPQDEYIVDSQGNDHRVKHYAYTYGNYNFESIGRIKLLLTKTWEPQPGYEDTFVNRDPAQITYSDGNANIVQACTRSEDGRYRMIQYRVENGGRKEIRTEPVFVGNCVFLASIEADARIFETQKDFFGRVTLTNLPDGDNDSPVGDISYAYASTDEGILKKTSTFPNGRSRIEVFDNFDRLISVTDPDGNILRYTYNPVGDLLTVTSGGVEVTRITYDKLGRKTDMWDSDMGTWRYTYDQFGRLERQTDARAAFIHYQYDSLGRVTRKEARNAQNQLENYEVSTYDQGADGFDVRLGELYQIQEFNGANELLRRTRYSYDPLFRRTTRIARFIAGLGEFDQELVYNWKGQLTQSSYPGGLRLHYQYLRTGSLQKVCETANCDENQGEVYYSLNEEDFDEHGALLKEDYGNGVYASYDYFPNSQRLQQKEIFRKDGQNNLKIFEKSYTYDAYSNVMRILDGGNRVEGVEGLPNGGLQNIDYDNLNRLTTFAYQDGAGAHQMSYDARGNILTNSALPNQQYQYDAVKPHRLTQLGDTAIEYDANGNITDDGEKSMQYDARNKLTTITLRNENVIKFDYDRNGVRVLKHVLRNQDGQLEEEKTLFLGDAVEVRDGNLLIHIHAGDRKIATKNLGPLEPLMAGIGGGALVNQGLAPDSIAMAAISPLAMLLFALLILMALRGRTGIALNETFFQFHHKTTAKVISLIIMMAFVMQIPSVSLAQVEGPLEQIIGDVTYLIYYHDDHLGSSTIITEGRDGARHAGFVYQKGQVLQRFEYTPWGQARFVLNPNLSFDPSYTGQTYDVETGLYYYRSRFYNPRLGRFVQPDNIVPYEKDFQAYNRYSYVANNPLKYTDPTGHIFGFFKKLFSGIVNAIKSVGHSFIKATVAVGRYAYRVTSVVVRGTIKYGGKVLKQVGIKLGQLLPKAFMVGASRRDDDDDEDEEEENAEVQNACTENCVYAVRNGRVFRMGWQNSNNHNSGLGYRISIRDDEGYDQYGHMDPDSLKVSVGDDVQAGQLLGQYADPTNGSSSGPHVHIERRLFPNPRETVDPGNVSPLGNGGRTTAPYGGIDHMHPNPHQGTDYAY